MNIKLFLKQKFCNHIWEDINSKLLRNMHTIWQNLEINQYDVYAVTQKCLKCDKTQLISKDVYTSHTIKLL